MHTTQWLIEMTSMSVRKHFIDEMTRIINLLDIQMRTTLNSDENQYDLTHSIISKSLFQLTKKEEWRTFKKRLSQRRDE